MSIAVIPARGGSKRIPRKNIRDFCGKPMLQWTLETLIASGLFERIVLSTDNAEIADLGRSLGAQTPFVRPPELSDDFATTRDVMRHAADFLKSDEPLCCIYATAPFIQVDDLVLGEKLLRQDKRDYVFSATQFGFPIQRALKENSDGSVSMFQPEHELTRSQDLEPAFHDAGQFYWGTPAAFSAAIPIFSSNSAMVKLPSYRVQDIDTHEDWSRAEAMFRAIGLDRQ